MSKKELNFKIAGFNIGKKHIIFLAIVVGVVGLVTLKGNIDRKKEEEEAFRQQQEALDAISDVLQSGNNDSNSGVFDVHKAMQESLIAQYGYPPEGFEWDYMGNLVPIGDDESSTSEDVVYLFLRSLSILSFDVAERYSMNSSTINSYKGYHNNYASLTNYYSNFLKSQFTKSLTSIEVCNIGDTAVFSDGTYYMTVNLNILDLTNKDFWLNDREKLFEQMRVYVETESDSTKANQYVYDYLIQKYEDGSVGKRNVNVELIISKINNGGWLISDDSELDAYLEYENGVDVAQYILNDFNNWYSDLKFKEQFSNIYGE